MTVTTLHTEPVRVDEPQRAEDYSDVLSQVVAEGKPVIVRRNGEDLAAVIPLEHLALLRVVVAAGGRKVGGPDQLEPCPEDAPAAAGVV